MRTTNKLIYQQGSCDECQMRSCDTAVVYQSKTTWFLFINIQEYLLNVFQQPSRNRLEQFIVAQNVILTFFWLFHSGTRSKPPWSTTQVSEVARTKMVPVTWPKAHGGDTFHLLWAFYLFSVQWSPHIMCRNVDANIVFKIIKCIMFHISRYFDMD